MFLYILVFKFLDSNLEDNSFCICQLKTSKWTEMAKSIS